MNKFLHIILVAGIILILGCEQRKATVKPSGKTVKVAVIAPMTGPDKRSGENALQGIQTALLLQPFLDNGDKIELVIEDNQGTSEQTLKALEKLHNQEDVVAVLLMAQSDLVLAAVQVADNFKIPVLALIATHPDITKNNEFITQLGFDDVHQGTVAALYVKDEMLIDRAAVISDPKNAHYSFLADAFIREYTSVDGEIVDHITAVPENNDMEKILERLRDNNTQLVYLAVEPKQVIQFVRTARKIGWNPRSMGSDGLLASIILNHNEDLDLVNGILATDFHSRTLPRNEYAKKAGKIFKKTFKAPVTSYAILGCEGTSILLHAMERCTDKTNRSCVNYMLRHTKEFQGMFGKIAIHNNGKTERPVLVNVIEGGKMKFLVKVY